MPGDTIAIRTAQDRPSGHKLWMAQEPPSRFHGVYMNRRPRVSQGTLSSCPVQEGRWGPCGLPTSIVPNGILSLLGHHLSPCSRGQSDR